MTLKQVYYEYDLYVSSLLLLLVKILRKAYFKLFLFRLFFRPRKKKLRNMYPDIMK